MNTILLLSSASQSATDIQQLQLLHQIQNHTMSLSHAFLLGWLLKFPLPQSIFSLQARLDLYNTLSSSHFPILSSLESNQLLFSLLIMAWPLWIMVGLICIYFLIKALQPLLQTIFPIIFSRFIKPQPLTFLELDFPSYTDKSAYATEQLYALIHTLAKRKTFMEGLTGKNKQYSLEIVSTKNDGIRFLLVVPANESEILRRSLLSYLPGIKIKEIDDYLNYQFAGHSLNVAIAELKLTSHFALPLNKQKTLVEHDPISYLTGHMTSLEKDGLVAFQVIATPLLNSIHAFHISEMHKLRQAMQKQEPLTPILQKNLFDQLSTVPVLSIFFFVIKAMWKIFSFILMFVYSMFLGFIDPNSKTIPLLMTTKAIQNANPLEILNPYEQELKTVVKEKIDQQLFESTIRILMLGKNVEELDSRMSGILSSFGMLNSSYQAFTTKSAFGLSPVKRRFSDFQKRMLSVNTSFNPNPILSTSELSDLYHPPYTDTTKTEGLVKSKSRDLPAPLSLKRDTTKLDVVVGKNNYGGEETHVGLTQAQRHEHTYIVGKTGMGKTTIIKQMAYQDILSGKGVTVIDPHGDLVKELLSVIPESRKKDVIYLDSTDKLWPVGLNILNPGGTFVDDEEKVDWITGSVISVFMKITPKANWGQRMEHILRNATMTALTTESPTLMTIQKLLTNKEYRQSVTTTLKDPVLKQFWTDEFKMFGNMQKADMISPLTNKLGEFITSPMSRYILLQAESTIMLSDIMDQGKVLLVNLSKGNLGEERSGFFGTLIISLIQMAAYQRAQIPENKRKDFFLYIDEFQNFATSHFADIFSEARKFHVFIIPSHQNVAQIEDVKTAKVVLGNSGTIISLKNGPDDEAVILPFMVPEVEKGEIVNLPPHHFFMKVTNEDSEDAFSGETVPLNIKGSERIKDFVIANTRKHYATPRAVVEKQLNILFGVSEEPEEKTGKKTGNDADKTNGVKENNTKVKNRQKPGNYAHKHSI